MGFTIHFYYIFGTNLLTGGPVPISVFSPVLVFCRKGISNGMKPSGELFLKQTQSRRLGVDVKKQSRRPRGREARPRGVGAPPPSWAPRGSPDQLPSPIYTHVPWNIQEHHETLFPPPQPFVPMRSHLGAFSGAPSEGESITEGFYINTIASLMSCEQFTTEVRVHSY